MVHIHGYRRHRQVVGVATLEEADPTEISFLANPKYEKALETTSAGAVIVSEDQQSPDRLTVLRDDPEEQQAAIANRKHIPRPHLCEDLLEHHVGERVALGDVGDLLRLFEILELQHLELSGPAQLPEGVEEVEDVALVERVHLLLLVHRFLVGQLLEA